MGWRTVLRWIEHPSQFASRRRHYSGNSADTRSSTFIKLQYYPSASLQQHRSVRGRELSFVVSEAPQWMQDKLHEVRRCLLNKKYPDALQLSLITTEEEELNDISSLLHKVDYYRRAVTLLTIHHAFEVAVDLFNTLSSQGVQPTTSIYVALLRSSQFQDPRYVRQILDRVLQLPPEQHSDISVEKILAAALDMQYPIDQVLHFFNRYKAFRGPTWAVRGVTFGHVVSAMMASGQHEIAKQALSDYEPPRLSSPKKHGVETNPGILSIMDGDLDSNPGDFFPLTTKESRNAMFSRLMKRPWPSQEWRVGRGAQTYPFTAFANGLQHSPSATLQDFNWICEQLVARDFYPHVHLCNILIDRHFHFGEEKKAFVLYRAMMDSSIAQLPLPSPDTFYLLFTLCAKRATLSVDTSHLHWAFHDMLCMQYFGTQKGLDEPYVSSKTLRAAYLLFVSLRHYDSALVVMKVMLDAFDDVSNDKYSSWKVSFWNDLLRDTIMALEQRALSEPTGWAQRFLGTVPVTLESRLSALRESPFLSSSAKHGIPEFVLLEKVMRSALQADLGYDAQWPLATTDDSNSMPPTGFPEEEAVAATLARRKGLVPNMWYKRGEKMSKTNTKTPRNKAPPMRDPRVKLQEVPESSIEYSVL